MASEFLQARLGPRGTPVFRLGLAASYRPGERAVRRALDEGINYFFCYGFDTQAIRVLRSLNADRREKIVIATGAYNYIWARQDFRKTLEKRLRQLRTDYLDAYLFLGVMKPREFPPEAQEQMQALREDPRVRSIGMSCHDRRFAAELAANGTLDMLMMRYNAAHRGAETEIFPRVEGSNAGITSYTATCWTKLLRKTRKWDGPAATAGQCYRFVLTDPHVQVCLTAPSNERQLEENLRAVRQGPLDAGEMEFLHRFGDAVHRR